MSKFLSLRLSNIVAENSGDEYFLEILRSEFERWPAFELDRRARRYLIAGANTLVGLSDGAPRDTVQSMTMEEERILALKIEDYELSCDETRHPLLVKICFFTYAKVKTRTVINPIWVVNAFDVNPDDISCDIEDTHGEYRMDRTRELRTMRLVDALFDAMLCEWRSKREDTDSTLGRVMDGTVFKKHGPKYSLKARVIAIASGWPKEYSAPSFSSSLSKRPFVSGKYVLEYFGTPERYFGGLRLHMVHGNLFSSLPFDEMNACSAFKPDNNKDVQDLSMPIPEAKLAVPWALRDFISNLWGHGDRDSELLRLRNIMRESGYGDHAIRIFLWRFWIHNCQNAELRAVAGKYEDYEDLIRDFEAREVNRLKIEAVHERKRSKSRGEVVFDDGEVELSRPTSKRAR